MSDFPGKTSKRRPRLITKEEDELRWRLALEQISLKEFERRYKMLKKKGLVKRM